MVKIHGSQQRLISVIEDLVARRRGDGSLSGLTVLVVEDNELNLELVEYLLEEEGFEIRRAMDADQARRELELGAPDVILMDMQLPGTDGLTLVTEIRTNDAMSKVPIIALTAHAMRGDRERFLRGGCDGYIAKPIDVGKFVDQVREILDCSEKEAE